MAGYMVLVTLQKSYRDAWLLKVWRGSSTSWHVAGIMVRASWLKLISISHMVELIGILLEWLSWGKKCGWYNWAISIGFWKRKVINVDDVVAVLFDQWWDEYINKTHWHRNYTVSIISPLIDLLYITQVTSTTNFVVMRISCAIELASLASDHSTPPVHDEFASPQSWMIQTQSCIIWHVPTSHKVCILDP